MKLTMSSVELTFEYHEDLCHPMDRLPPKVFIYRAGQCKFLTDSFPFIHIDELLTNLSSLQFRFPQFSRRSLFLCISKNWEFSFYFRAWFSLDKHICHRVPMMPLPR